MHAAFPYVSIHSRGHSPIKPALNPPRLRGFETSDLSQWQRLLHEGYDLKACTLDVQDVRRCLGRLSEDCSGGQWPIGGIHVLESEEQVICMVRVMLFPSHAELRTARVTSRDRVEPLIELIFHTLRRVCRTRLGSVVMGQDISPEQAGLIAEALGWSMTPEGERVVLHILPLSHA